jgi:hypothetical protein
MHAWNKYYIEDIKIFFFILQIFLPRRQLEIKVDQLHHHRKVRVSYSVSQKVVDAQWLRVRKTNNLLISGLTSHPRGIRYSSPELETFPWSFASCLRTTAWLIITQNSFLGRLPIKPNKTPMLCMLEINIILKTLRYFFLFFRYSFHFHN